MARLFISTDRLEAWTAEGRAALDGEHMTLIELSRSFKIRAAVRFIGVTGDDADPHQLVGLVKDVEQLAAMGADHMADSVIYVDTAYKVQNGFLGEPIRS
ncbi:MAG: hypothetical protein R2939_22075 [Kofleriaceae bacterium]